MGHNDQRPVLTKHTYQIPLTQLQQMGQTTELPPVTALPPLVTGTGDGSDADGRSLLDQASNDRPPRGRGRPRKATADERIYSMLCQVYGGAGLLMYTVNSYDGMVLSSKAEDCAKAWLGVAHQHKELYRTLDFLSTNNAYLLLIMSHTAIVVAVAVNHNLIPPVWGQRMGIQPPPAPEPVAPPNQPVFGSGALAGFTPEQLAQIQALAQAQAGQASQNPVLTSQLVSRRG
jgi:hypothetical protein